MSIELEPLGAADQAADAAAHAARDAGLAITEVVDIATLARAAHLMDVVWSDKTASPLGAAHPLSHAGVH